MGVIAKHIAKGSNVRYRSAVNEKAGSGHSGLESVVGYFASHILQEPPEVDSQRIKCTDGNEVVRNIFENVIVSGRWVHRRVLVSHSAP